MKDYTEIFAENLHRMRKAKGLTQSRLAEIIRYTEKAVSKWESGGAIPPAETLIKLAEIFNVSLDELFDHITRPSYYLGIDGGATKTTFALASREGNIIRKIVLGPSNPFDLGFEEASKIIREGIEQVSENISKRKISMFAGISGSGNAEMRERFRAFLGGFGFLSYDVDSDGKNILAEGIEGERGAVIIMGTGSSCFCKSEGIVSRVGGLGYLFDRGGCGYNVGRDAIVAVCKFEDGRGEATALCDMLYSELKTSSLSDDLTRLYELGKSGIASLCPIVFEAYEMGDAVAAEILKSNAECIAELISAAAEKTKATPENPVEIVFVGSLTKRWDVLGGMIEKALRSDVLSSTNLKVYSGDVVHGALKLAGMPV